MPALPITKPAWPSWIGSRGLAEALGSAGSHPHARLRSLPSTVLKIGVKTSSTPSTMAGSTLAGEHTFVWPYPGSTRVQVAGSFNAWQPEDMSWDAGTKTWRLQRSDLRVGQSHEFKFVLDQTSWVHDEHQPSVANEVGSTNNQVTVSAPAPTNLTSPPVVEVERKFLVPEDFSQRLLEHGFQPVAGFEEEILVDEYLDTPEGSLMKRDHWLRLRNGDWELKYPVSRTRLASSTESAGNPDACTTLYHETTSVDDIQDKLRRLEAPLALDGARGEDNLQACLAQGSLTHFARIQTTRATYRQPHDRLTVVVDATDWGYRVGELEIVVDAADQVEWASRRIDELAASLGLSSVLEGKMDSYLRTYRPDLYQVYLKRLEPDQPKETVDQPNEPMEAEAPSEVAGWTCTLH